jgi:hypothetical protein
MKNPTNKQTLDLSPQEIENRNATGIPLDGALTSDEISAREREKQTLVAQYTPKSAEPETPPVAASQRYAPKLGKAAAERLREWYKREVRGEAS